MAETVQEIVKRGSLYIPPENRKCYIKRLQLNNEYESDWYEVSSYIIQFGTITQGFPDGAFLGEYNESDLQMVIDNNQRRWNEEGDPDSIFNGFKTRYRTKFKVELWLVDVDDNDVLAKTFYGILLDNPKTSDNGSLSVAISPITKVLQSYKAAGIDESSADTETLVSRLMSKTQNGISIFDRFFEGYSINPQSVATTTIAPVIEDDDTVLDKLRDFSFYDNFFYYVNDDGYFVWDSRSETTSIVAELNGGAYFDSVYGNNIVSIDSEYADVDNTYTSVVIKYKQNGVLDEKTFSGIRKSDDSASLSDANSLTIFNWMKTDYLDANTYRLSHQYTEDRSTLESYLSSTWAGYDLTILDRLDGFVQSDDKAATSDVSWTPGDGSLADVYGEKILSIDKAELGETQAATIADNTLAAYKDIRTRWDIKVFGLFYLMPKDKITINYIGDVSVVNPFILDVSTLDGTDVLGSRTGSINLVSVSAKVEEISINLDTFDILVKAREI